MATISKNQIAYIKKLYNQQECSARQIAEQLNVSLDAVYYAMRRHSIKRRFPSENNRIYFKNKPLSYNLRKNLSPDQQLLKLAGIMLYWSEGYKTEKSSGIDFANSDTEMLRVFIHFLRDICGIDEKRIRIYLYCHDTSSVNHLINYWSKKLHIPKTQFTKPYIHKHSNLEKRHKMPYGLVHIRYSDIKLLKEILNLIEVYKKQLCVGGGVVNRIGL